MGLFVSAANGAIGGNLGASSSTQAGMPDGQVERVASAVYEIPEKYKTFQWNPFEKNGPWDSLKKDTYVKDQWGKTYYVDTLSGFFNTMKTQISKGEFCKAFQTFFYGLYYVEVANIVKGLVGIFGTLLPTNAMEENMEDWNGLIFHALKTVFYFVGVIGLGIAYCGLSLDGDSEAADEIKQKLQDYLLKFLSNFGHIFKDIVTIIASTGHMVSALVPLAVSAIPLPGTSAAGAAIATGILLGFRAAANVTGVFDLMANVGTGILLGLEKSFINQKLKELQDKPENVMSSGEKAKRSKELSEELVNIDKDFEHLKSELNPARFGGFCVWLMMLNAVAGFMEFFLPSSGTILTTFVIPHVHTFAISQAEVIHYASVLGATSAGALGMSAYEKRKKQKEEQERSEKEIIEQNKDLEEINWVETMDEVYQEPLQDQA